MLTAIRIKRFLSRFKRREHGSLSLEAVLTFPIFVWAITLTYTYFDAFRESTINLKAAYTVGDLISREGGEVPINDAYAASMYLLFYRILDNNSPLEMRLTSITFKKDESSNSDEPRHFVEWATRCGYDENWTNDNVDQLSNRLPPMAELDSLILVETTNDYIPSLTTTWLEPDQTFDTFVYTRPRFVPLVPGNVSPVFCDNGSVAVATAG